MHFGLESKVYRMMFHSHSSLHSTDPVLSVIIPFSYRNGDSHCLNRLNNVLNCFKDREDIEVILFDTSPTRHKGSVSLITSMQSVKYFHVPQGEVFSAGQTRNKAVQKANGQYLFFCDADLMCSDQVVDELLQQTVALIQLGSQAFAMFPCLYLSEKVTGGILEGAQPDYQKYRRSYFKGELNCVDGIAVASSCLLVEREWFIKIGGFRSEFAGHGCDDFELIHRLAAYFPIGRLADDYALDWKHQFPAEYRGFRRYYSYYALPHLFAGHFLLHQWHPRPLARLYHRRRKTNEQLFSDILNNQTLPACDGIAPFASNRPLPDFREWILAQMQQHNLDVGEYPGLFHWQEGVSKSSGGFRRKLRKLILKPGQFFKDMR